MECKSRIKEDFAKCPAKIENKFWNIRIMVIHVREIPFNVEIGGQENEAKITNHRTYNA
jgi:hypothetical protein